MKNMKMLYKINLKIVIILVFLMSVILSNVAFAGDPIDNVTSYAREKIITIFLVVVAFIITKSVVKNATTKLIGFIAIAIIGGVLVYKPEILGELANWLSNVIVGK